MKHKTKRMWRSVIALALTFTLVFGTAGTAFATSGGVQARNTEVEKDVINYVSLGDSMTNGYGLPGYQLNSGVETYGYSTYANQLAAHLAGMTDEQFDAAVANATPGTGFGQTFEGPNGIVNHAQLSMSGIRAEDLHWLLELDYNDPDAIGLIKDIIDAEGEKEYNAYNWRELYEEEWNATFTTGDYWTLAEICNHSRTDATWQALVGGTLEEKSFEGELDGFEYPDTYPQALRGNQDKNAVHDAYKIALIAKYYQEHVTDADVVSLAVGNGNFGVYAFGRILEAIGFSGTPDKAMVYNVDNAIRELDSAMQDQIKALKAELEATAKDYLATAGFTGDKADALLNTVVYTGLSFAINYAGAIDAILQLNPDAEIIEVALMSTMAKGEGEVALGDLMEAIITPMNAFIAAVPTYMQATGNSAYEDATFYYAEEDSVASIASNFAPVLDDKTSVVRARFVQDIVGNVNKGGMIWGMLGGLELMDDVALTHITLEDIEAYEDNPVTFAVEKGASKAVSVAVYLAFEQAIVEVGGKAVGLDAVLALGNLDASIFSGVMESFGKNIGTNSAAQIDKVATLIAEQSGGMLTAEDVKLILNDGEAGIKEVAYGIVAEQSGGMLTAEDLEEVYTAEDKAAVIEAKAYALIAGQSGGMLTAEELEDACTYGYFDFAAGKLGGNMAAEDVQYAYENNLLSEEQKALIDALKNAVVAVDTVKGALAEAVTGIDTAIATIKAIGISDNANMLSMLLAVPDTLSTALQADPAISGVVALFAACNVGDGVGSHPSAAGHDALADAVIAAYENGYTPTDKTKENIDIALEEIAKQVDAYGIMSYETFMEIANYIDSDEFREMCYELKDYLDQLNAATTPEQKAEIYKHVQTLLGRMETAAAKVTAKDLELNEDSYYVSIGDSTLTGYGLDQYIPNQNNGEGQVLGVEAPVLLAEKLFGEDYADQYKKLDKGGIRLDDLMVWLGDESYIDDFYNRYTMDANAAMDETKDYQDLYESEIKKADLITLAIGGGNITTFVGQQIKELQKGEDGQLYEMDWSKYYSGDEITEAKKSVEAVKAVLAGKLPEVEGVPAEELLSVVAESFVFGLAGYMTNYSKVADRIHEINPDAHLVIVGYFNPIGEISLPVKFGEETVELPVGAMAELVTLASNAGSLSYTFANLDNTTYVSIKDATTILEEQGETDSEIIIAGAFVDSWKTHAGPEGHKYIADQLYAGITNDYEIHEIVIEELQYLLETYGPMAAEFAYNYAEENGYIDMAKEALAELEAQLEILKAEAEKLTGQAKAEAEKAIAEIEKAIAELEALLKAEAEAFTQELIAQIGKQLNILENNLKELAEILIAEGTAAAEKAVNEALAALEELTTVAADKFQKALKEGAEWLVKEAGEAYENFVNAAVEAAKKYAPEADKYLYDWFMNNPDKVIGFFTEYGDEFAKLAEEYGDETLAVLGFVVYEFGDDAVEFIMNNPEKALDALNTWYDKYGEKTWKMIDSYLEYLGVYDVIEDAVADADAALKEAIATLMGQMDEFAAKAAEKVWSAIEGDKIVETIEEAIAAVEKAIADFEAMIADIEAQIAALEAQLDKLYAELEKASGELKAEIEKQIAAIEAAIDALEAEIAKIEKAIEDLKAAIKEAEEAVKAIIEAANGTYEDIVAAIEAVKEAMAEIADIVADVENFIADAIEVIKALDKAVKDANEELKAIVDAIESIFEMELPTIDFAAINAAIEAALAEGADYIAKKVDEAYNAFVEAVIAAIPAADAYLYDWLYNNPDKVIGFFAEYGDDFAKLAEEYGEYVLYVLGAVAYEYGDEAVEFIMNNPEKALDALNTWYDKYGEKTWKMIDRYLEYLGVYDVIEDAVADADSAIKAALADLDAAIAKYSKEAAEKIWAAVEGDKIVEAVEDAIAAVEKAIADFEAMIADIEAQIAALEAELNKLYAELEKATGELKAEIEKQIAAIEAAIDALEAEIAKIEKAIEDLKAVIKEAEAAVKAIIEAANGTYEDIVAAIEAVKDAMAEIAGIVADVEDFIADAIEVIEALDKALKDADEDIKAIVDAIKGLFDCELPTIDFAAIDEAIREALAEGADYLAKKVDEAYNAFVEAVVAVVKEQAPKAAEFVYNWLVENPDKVIAFFAEYGDEMTDFIVEYQEEILAVLGYLADEYGDEVMDYVMDNADVILAALVDLVKEHGDDAWKLIDAYLDELGVFDMIGDAVETAKNDIEAALNALYAAINEYSKDAVEKLWNSIEGDKIVETVKDAIAEVESMIADLEAMIAQIEKQIASLEAQLNQLYADLEKANAELKAQIEKQIDAIESAIAMLEAQIDAIEKAIEDLQKAVEEAKELIKAIAEATNATYEEIAAIVGQLKDVIADIADIAADIEGFIAEAIEVIKALDEAVKDANADIKAIVDAIEELLAIDLPEIDFAAIDEAIADALKEVADFIAKKADEAYDAFVEAAVAAVEKYAPAAAEFVYNWLVENPDVVIGFFAEYGDDIIDFIVDNQETIAEIIGWIADNYGEEIAGFVMDNADVILAGLVDLVSEYGDEAWTMIEAYLIEMGILPIDTTVISDAIAAINALVEKFGADALEMIKASLTKYAEKVMDTLKALEDAAKDAVDDFIAEIEKQIADLEAQLNKLYAELEKANAELKAQLEKQIAQIEKQIASLKAQIAAVEEMLADLYDAVKEAEAAVKELIKVLEDNADTVAAVVKEVIKAMQKVGEAIDFVVSNIDEISEGINAAIDTINGINEKLMAIADMIGDANADLKAIVEETAALVADIKAIVDNADEELAAYADRIQKALETLYSEVTHGEYTVTEDSLYVALGDNLADNSYVAKLAAALDMDDQYYDANMDGIRAEDLLYFLDENYKADEFAKAAYGDIAEEKRAELTEVIEAADLITLNFSNNTITDFTIDQVMASLDGYDLELDWSAYADEEGVAAIKAAVAELNDYLYEQMGAMSATITAAIENYAYAYIGHMATYDDAIKAVKAINPEAKVILVGMYNPFEGAVLTSEGTEIALGEYVGALVELCNGHYAANAMAKGGYIYVAAPDVEIAEPFTGAVDAMDFVTGFFMNGFEALEPSDAGHEYIKDQILGALDITSKAASKAEEAFKALDELGDITGDNLEDAKAIVEAAREAYDALSQEEKEALGIEVLDKLVEAEKAIVEIEIADAEAKNEENKEVLNDLKDKLQQAELDLAEIERVLAVTNSKVAKVTVTNNKSTVKASWTAVKKADRYAVKLYRNGKQIGKTKYTNKTSMTFTNQLRGGKYKVVVSPFAKALGANYYGFEKASNIKQIKLLKPTVKTTKVGKYTRIKAADQNSTGFQIYISKDKKFNKKDKLITVKTDKKALNKKLSNKKYFKKGKTYIKVRAYSTINGKKVYGKWSKVKTIKR